MLSIKTLLPIALAVAYAGSVALCGPVPQEDIEKIQQAAPAKPPVEPKNPRKVLVYSRMEQFKHESTPWIAEAFRVLGEKTGAYTPVLSDEPSMFDRDALFGFDAVVFNNNCDSGIRDPQRRQNLLDFVASGRGFVAIHSASFPDQWPEFVDLLGGRSVSHPWQNGIPVFLSAPEPDHPLVRAFADETMRVATETFIFADFKPERSRVLVEIDKAKTDMTLPDIENPEGRFPLVWVHNYGKGRVFYCMFGHEPEMAWNATVLRYYLAGTQFALGDLEADASPRPAAAK